MLGFFHSLNKVNDQLILDHLFYYILFIAYLGTVGANFRPTSHSTLVTPAGKRTRSSSSSVSPTTPAKRMRGEVVLTPPPPTPESPQSSLSLSALRRKVRDQRVSWINEVSFCLYLCLVLNLIFWIFQPRRERM